MALSKDEIKAAYPLPVYNYRVDIGSDTIAFSEVSGLGISHETTTYKESPVESGSPGPRVMHMPGQGTPANVTLNKGIVRGSSVATFFDWINSNPHARFLHLLVPLDRFCDLIEFPFNQKFFAPFDVLFSARNLLFFGKLLILFF